MTLPLRDALEASLGSAYRIERELGGGGMSRVFVAEDQRLRRRVVIKVLAPELAQGFSVQRFEREIQMAAGLQQANIVGVLSAGDVDGLPYYIMPFVDGLSLRAQLDSGPMSVPNAVHVLRDVAKALAYAHRQGVVHRDIKPDNVLLSSGTAVVADFGIAKAISAARTQSPEAAITQVGMSIGTPAYMAPEQAAGDPDVDHRADLYALGAMAYELLTGQLLFPDRTPQRTLAAQLGEAPVDIRSVRPDLPAALGALVMRLLEKDPNARLQTAVEVVQELDAVSSASSSTGSVTTGVPSGSTMSLGKALAVYGVSAVAALALTQLAVVYVGLPDWVLPGALLLTAAGLPIVLWTGYVKRVATASPTLTPGGTRIATKGMLATLAMRAAPQASWRRTARRGAFAFAGFAALVAVVMSLRALGIGPEGSLIAANKLSANDKVVLADFVVAGADTSLRAALTTALRTQLEQSSVVQIVPQSSVTAALERMRLPSDGPLVVAVARDIAQREGAKAVIAADAALLGDGYLVTERLIDAASGDVLASYAETAGSSAELLKAIDATAKKLRGRMGESLKALRAAPSLEVVTTSSLEALKKYAEAGEAGSGRGDFVRAVRLGEEAVRLDSTFALAWRRLALDYGNARMPASLTRGARNNAYRYRDRLPAVERALVTGAFFGTAASGYRARAAEAYAEALRLDSVTSNGGSASSQLTNIARTRRDFVEAERLARLNQRATPDLAPGYGGLATALLAQGKLDTAREALDVFERKFPTAALRPSIAADFLSNARKYDSLPARMAPFLASPNPSIRRNAWLESQYTATVLGRAGEALRYRDSLNTSVEARTRDDSLAFTISRLFISLDLERDIASVVKQLDEISSNAYLAPIPVEQRRYYTLVDAYVRAGQLAKAKALFARAEASATTADARAVYVVPRHRALAEIALAERRYADALKEFRAADQLPDGPSTSCAVCLSGDLARVFDAAGKADSAIVMFTTYHKSAGLISRSYDASNLAGSYKRLGELYEAKGDVRRAVEQYDKFVALWKNADPELQPLVNDVRRRITRLTPVEARQ